MIYLYVKLFFICFPNIKLFISFFKFFKIYEKNFRYFFSNLNYNKLKIADKEYLEKWGKIYGIKRKKYERYNKYRERLLKYIKNNNFVNKL